MEAKNQNRFTRYIRVKSSKTNWNVEVFRNGNWHRKWGCLIRFSMRFSMANAR